MKTPLACMFGLHLWRRCEHLFSSTKVHWHCRRCDAARTTSVPR